MYYIDKDKEVIKKSAHIVRNQVNYYIVYTWKFDAARLLETYSIATANIITFPTFKLLKQHLTGFSTYNSLQGVD